MVELPSGGVRSLKGDKGRGKDDAPKTSPRLFAGTAGGRPLPRTVARRLPMTRNVMRKAILEKGKTRAIIKGRAKAKTAKERAKARAKTKARRTRECEQWEKGAWIRKSLRVSA